MDDNNDNQEPNDLVPSGHGLTASLQAIRSKDHKDQEGKNLVGRPQHHINWDKVETAMSLGVGLKGCAMYGGVHWNTLERRCIERYGEGFKEVRDAFLTDMKALASDALKKKIKQGDTKAILFANRVFNNMDDRVKRDDEDDKGNAKVFKMAYNLDKTPDEIEAEFRVREDDEL